LTRKTPAIAPRRDHKKTVLAIDIGGSHVKMKLSPDSEKRKFRSGPTLTAKKMVARVLRLTEDWTYDVVSIGYPGPVIHNRPLAEPHNLGRGWAGFDFEQAFRTPVRVVNDAVMQALGSYRGDHMLFLGLGTGLGAAMIVDGAIEPMELAHLQYKNGKTFEYYLGRAGLKRMGAKRWRAEVIAAVDGLVGALEPDYVVIGGGNAAKLKTLPQKSRLGSNENAFSGGFRLWLAPDHRRCPDETGYLAQKSS
jgi:polyphosphate glucokinase